jgi:hypothetical protein
MRNLSECTIEIWADSFKEGEWFLQNLALKYYHGRFEVSFRYNFQPIFHFTIEEERRLLAEVYGDYASWVGIPAPIKEILRYGKPDIIVYDPATEKVVLSAEETAAVPTGNQSLQRLERVWFAAKNKIPFVYLISEYGLHKNGGVRRSSIWPVYLALKLSSQYCVPSLTLFYGSSTSPENYSVGNGLPMLTELSHIYILEWLGYDMREKKKQLLKTIFKDMCTFIQTQTEEIAAFLPGKDILNDELIDFLIGRVVT